MGKENSDTPVTMEALAQRMRLLQLIAGGAVLVAVVSLFVAVWALRDRPGTPRADAPDKLRFVSGDHETVVDGDGIRHRSLSGAAVATLSAKGLTLAAADSKLDMTGHALSLRAGDDGPSLQLTVAPSKTNPWAAISMSSKHKTRAGFDVRVASGGNSMSLRSPSDRRRAIIMWASRSALMKVADAKKKQRIELQTAGEGLETPQLLIEHGKHDREFTAVKKVLRP